VALAQQQAAQLHGIVEAVETFFLTLLVFLPCVFGISSADLISKDSSPWTILSSWKNARDGHFLSARMVNAGQAPEGQRLQPPLPNLCGSQ